VRFLRASAPLVVPPVAPPVATPPPKPPAPSVTGIWLGALEVPGHALRLQLRLDLAAGPKGCVLDSLDQHAFGLPCGNVVVSGDALSFEVPVVKGTFAGNISADGSTLTGHWTQMGAPLALVLTRRATPIEKPKAPLDAAMPAIDVAALPPILAADLAAALEKGALAPDTGGGVAIGVVQHGVRRILSYGATRPDAVFEIGSVTKTFTGLILAQMVEQKKARFDEPVRELLPPGTVAAPASGAEITLVDLSTQHSGLPRMPDNFNPKDPANPYADYDEKALFSWLGAHGVALPPKAPFGYSNLGVGLLGAALAHRAGTTYEALLKKEVTGPIGMRDTSITLTPAMQKRLAAGHDPAHKPARAWDLDALAGAGGIRSTAADMLTYLEAELHPDHLPATAKASPEGKTLPGAIAASHEPRAETEEGMHIALNWFRRDKTGSYWHNGATGGYSSFVLFNVDKDLGIVVLSNTALGEDGFTDRIGQYIAQRFWGVEAVSLGPLPPVAP